MHSTNEKAIQLIYLCALLTAVNKSCREMKDITYSSGDSDSDHVLTPFQVFLCKLAQVCDNRKGSDTITALVALRNANGPGYHFASNNRKKTELDNTKEFLSSLLDFAGTNPDGLAEKALRKQVLWRILEFNFPRVDYYLKRIVSSIGECIQKCSPFVAHDGSNVVMHLKRIEDKAKFPHDMSSGANAKPKFLSDCEALIRCIQSARETGFSEAINEHANAGDSESSHSWCELRHYLGRLHSYRQAAEWIVRASKEWPELFTGFTVAFIPSSRVARLSLPRPTPSPSEVIQSAFPDMDIEEYSSHIENLREHHLDHFIEEELGQKSMRQFVHCEVHLHEFLVRGKTVASSDYWNGSMFVATSKPPCRLCHYYFNDPDNQFEVQSSHLNVYPKWRLPDIYEGGEDTVMHREELLDDIIEQMQQVTLRIVKEKVPQGKRNDSRTESRAGLSTVSGLSLGERSDTRNFGHFSSMSGTSGRGIRTEGLDFGSPLSAADSAYLDVGAAL